MPHQYTPKDIRRFNSKTDRSGGPDACWPWLGRLIGHGYGRIDISRDGKERAIKAHRFAYEIANGTIDPNLVVRHTCDNSPCCNPKHLIQGTHLDNVHDRDSRNRTARGTRNGGGTKLTDDKAREILVLLDAGATQWGLAKRYDVSRACIRSIAKGWTWKHVSIDWCRHQRA